MLELLAPAGSPEADIPHTIFDRTGSPLFLLDILGRNEFALRKSCAWGFGFTR